MRKNFFHFIKYINIKKTEGGIGKKSLTLQSYEGIIIKQSFDKVKCTIKQHIYKLNIYELYGQGGVRE